MTKNQGENRRGKRKFYHDDWYSDEQLGIDYFVDVLPEGRKSEMYVGRENVRYHFVPHRLILDQADDDFSSY